MNQLKTDNRGMILVFTLLLLGVFLSTALTFSYFVISDINKARAIDDSIIAYYSADAGMEESLYLLRKQPDTNTLDLVKTARATAQQLTSSRGNWDISSSTDYEKAVLRQRLYNGQSIKFFILNRGTESNNNQTKSITLEWYKGEGKTPRLQVNLTQLATQNASGTIVYYTDVSEIQVADSSGHNKDVYCYDLNDYKINSVIKDKLSEPVDYMAEFKVLGTVTNVPNSTNDDYVERLLVKAYNDSCSVSPNKRTPNPQGITNLTLKSKGTYGRATQNIIAQVLPRDPLSGLMGFVLFSENDVIKN